MKISNSISLNFKNDIEKKEKKNNAFSYLDGSLLLGAVALGTGGGYKFYNDDKVELQNSIKKIKNNATKEEQDIKPVHDESQKIIAKYQDDKKALLEKAPNKTEILKQELKNFHSQVKEQGLSSLMYDEEALDEMLNKATPGPTSCIKISSPNNELSEAFIEIARSKVGNKEYGEKYDFVKVPDSPDCNIIQENFKKHLEKAEENYQKTQKSTLIYVEGFDKLCEKQLNTPENIKELRSSIIVDAYEKYHSIILFKTDHRHGLYVTHLIHPGIHLNDKEVTLSHFETLKNKKIEITEKIKTLETEHQGKLKELDQKIETETQKIAKTTEEIAKRKNQIKEMETKLTKLSKTKIFAGLLIGAIAGATAIAIKNRPASKEK